MKLGEVVKIIIGVTSACLVCSPAVAQQYIVREGHVHSVIVARKDDGGLSSFAARELQKYVGELTGGLPNVVEPTFLPKLPKDEVVILVGGPAINPLVKEAEMTGQVDFGGLKPEGFLLKTIEFEGHPALVVGGNDEPGTVYGAYDWLERQGIVFQISHDVIPNHRDSLPLNRLNVRSEPSFNQRGFLIVSVYATRSIWSYSDLTKFIDQMAKLKLNYLIWHMFSTEPYLEYSYRGEKKRLGDSRDWQSGYLLPTYGNGSHKVEDYFEGKEAFEKFGRRYLAPDEWQGVQDEEQVYRRAQDLLQRTIHYAKSRNVKVWLALESLDEMETNTARCCRRIVNYSRPFNPYHGSGVCPTDPAVFEINGIRFKALLSAYPEAEGYIFWMPEHYQVCDHPEDKELFQRERPKFQGIEPRIAQSRATDFIEPRMVDNSIAMVHLFQKILEVRELTAPKVKIGVGMWGRAFLLPTLDAILPKDVRIVDMESSGLYTPKGVPMQYFSGMNGRERTLVPRLVDDSGMIGLQFHLRLFDRDRVLAGALQTGVAGHAAYADRFRGEEHHARYLAEGAWNPDLMPDQFYRDYSRKVFGEQAEHSMFQAFMALEDKEAHEGYHVHKPMDISCCGPPDELSLIKEYAEQPNPYDGPTFKEWGEFVKSTPRRIKVFTEELRLEEKALGFMKMAECVVTPGAEGDLHYLENKTRAYNQLLEVLVQLNQAIDNFDQAFQFDPRLQREEFLKRLDASLLGFENGRVLARACARTFAEVVDNVSDLGILHRLNVHLVVGTELIAQFMETIRAYHYGRPYVSPVEWDKVFQPEPKFAWGDAN
jgi:hypothetical protein